MQAQLGPYVVAGVVVDRRKIAIGKWFALSGGDYLGTDSGLRVAVSC